MWGIIAGTGFEKSESVKLVKELDRNTPFGLASSGLKIVSVKADDSDSEHQAVFIPRHGKNHELLPTEVNYRANIFALKQHGVKNLISVSAVGSLNEQLPPGTLVIPDQYIDRTKGIRASSFGGEGIVAHVSLAKPISPTLKEHFLTVTNSLKEKSNQSLIKISNMEIKVQVGGTYICIEGPYFSTKAESNSYRQLEASIIGMTNFPEYALAREAGIAYLPCCFVTDFDCWDDSIPHVTVEEVLKQMKHNNLVAYSLIPHLINKGADKQLSCETTTGGSIKSGLMVDKETLTKSQQDILEILFR